MSLVTIPVATWARQQLMARRFHPITHNSWRQRATQESSTIRVNITGRLGAELHAPFETQPQSLSIFPRIELEGRNVQRLGSHADVPLQAEIHLSLSQCVPYSEARGP